MSYKVTSSVSRLIQETTLIFDHDKLEEPIVVLLLVSATADQIAKKIQYPNSMDENATTEVYRIDAVMRYDNYNYPLWQELLRETIDNGCVGTDEDFEEISNKIDKELKLRGVEDVG